jgi:hypothetical protein
MKSPSQALPNPALLRLICLGLAVIFLNCTRNRVISVKESRASYPFRSGEPRSEIWRKADSLWELREDPAAARQSLKAYRSAAKRHKKSPELLAKAAHACSFVATFVEFSPEARDRLFREGQAKAQEAMMLDPGFHARYRETGDEVEAARELDTAYVEALYWYVVNLGRELNQESVIVRRGNRERLETLNDHLLRIDETFQYGGPHRIAGSIPTRLPEGDLGASKAHFEKAIALAPLYLGNRVAYADFYAVRAKDKALFVDQLNRVTAVPADTLPEITPENRLSQAQAKALLAKTTSLFP